MFFPVVMYGCESWTVKKAECQRIDVFELWCWKSLLRVPWTAGRFHPKGNQLWIFIGRSDVEAETPILWLPNAKNQLIGKDPNAGKIEDGRRREQQRMRWSHGITDLMDMNLSKLRELITHREIWRSAVCGVTKSQTWRSDWTELNWTELNWTQSKLWHSQ